MPKHPVLLTVSDLHFCHTAPPCRARELDWYAAMKRSVQALTSLRRQLCNPPLAVAGDIFDRWNPPHELVSWVIENFPACYAVPGQHDLPNHRYCDIHKSAYWTLVQAGVITDLKPGVPVGAGEVRLHGFPWGEPPSELKKSHGLCLEVAVIHHLVHTKDTAFHGAPESSQARTLQKKFKGFDTAVFGDNHKGFSLWGKPGLPTLLNNGTFMRRRSDEENYTPCAGVVYSDGSVERVPLEVEEVFDRVEKDGKPETRKSFKDILKGLNSLSEVCGDYREELKRELDRRESSPRVRSIATGGEQR